MKTVVRGGPPATVPVAGVPLLAGAPARAAEPVTDATCVMKAYGVFAHAVGPAATVSRRLDQLVARAGCRGYGPVMRPGPSMRVRGSVFRMRTHSGHASGEWPVA